MTPSARKSVESVTPEQMRAWLSIAQRPYWQDGQPPQSDITIREAIILALAAYQASQSEGEGAVDTEWDETRADLLALHNRLVNDPRRKITDRDIITIGNGSAAVMWLNAEVKASRAAAPVPPAQPPASQWPLWIVAAKSAIDHIVVNRLSSSDLPWRERPDGLMELRLPSPPDTAQEHGQ